MWLATIVGILRKKKGREQKSVYISNLLEGRLAAPTVLKYQAKDCYIIMLCGTNLE